MALLRLSAQELNSREPESVVEVLLERMLIEHGQQPSDGEINSWKKSLPLLASDLCQAGLGKVEVLLEHRLPLTSRRIDVLLAGTEPGSGRNSYVLLELKQWSQAHKFEDDENLVRVPGYLGTAVTHPCLQADNYLQYMKDFLPGLNSDHAAISAAVYLHNATVPEVSDLFEHPVLATVPIFTSDEKHQFFEWLARRLSPLSGVAAGDALLNQKIGPSKQLLREASKQIREREQFTLLAEQQDAYLHVLHAVRGARRADRKRVIVVSGGPGSGKSVIALSLLGELARQGHSVLHATGSKSFTSTLRKVAGRGSSRVASLFKYFNSFMEIERNSLDVLICDEAHRIRRTSVNRYTRAHLRSERTQLDELLAAARVPVFLLDENQVVRPGEMGSVEEISQYAEHLGYDVLHINLNAQFRCGGSEVFVTWVQRLLGLEPGGPIPWHDESTFTVSVVDSPDELERMLSRHSEAGYGARMTAGYCWPWSDPDQEGNLINDVVVGGWTKPWNLKSERAVSGAPPSALWASDPAGFGQVGCIYTAQGFEYDWNGVIFGPDLVWRTDKWVAVRGANKDPDFRSITSVSSETFDLLVRNVYKVLLTRGLQGALIYSVDGETQDFLKTIVNPR